jgi:hypothetical protein
MKLVSPLCFILATALPAAPSESALDHKIDAHIEELVKLAATPEIVEAVVAQNRKLPPSYSAMTQEKWAALDKLDPMVFQLKTNPVGKHLGKLPRPLVAGAFVNDAAGHKVGFLEKPAAWKHAGKPKHDQPMAGAIWQGAVELESSSGTRQVQVAVPVVSNGKPVGSLVVSLKIFELAEL